VPGLNNMALCRANSVTIGKFSDFIRTISFVVNDHNLLKDGPGSEN
jgi:hypothetical protein